MLFHQYEELQGKRSLKDIVDKRGVLLVSKDTILADSHIERLRRLQIEIIYNVHVEEGTNNVEVPGKASKLIKQLESEFKEIDDLVRSNDNIPLTVIHETVIPAIHTIIDKHTVYQIFSSFLSTGDFRYKQIIGVATLATLLGQWLSLEEKELSSLTLAATLYDIGSAKLPSHLVHLGRPYEQQEFEIVKHHTKLGYDLLHANKDLDPRVALAALQHHEREDGSGYPAKLKGDQIQFFSKIIGLIDVYVAKMSERPHRLKLSFYEVMEDLRKDIFQGTFNSYIGMTFLQHMMLAQVGSEVVLSDGRKGKIIFVHANYPTKPLVSVGETFVDLSKETAIKIKEILG